LTGEPTCASTRAVPIRRREHIDQMGVIRSAGTMALRLPRAAMGRPMATERRSFLNLLLGSGTVATLSAVFYPVLRFMNPPRLVESSASSVVAAKVTELRPNEGKIFKFGSKPGLLIQTAAGEYRAFTAICSHLDCTVQFRSDEKMIWCACHNGRYDLTGKNVSGPPPRPLEEFHVNLRGDDVIVSRG
jgi:cytochrome b6-f complex iron-sulfur subunit